MRSVLRWLFGSNKDKSEKKSSQDSSKQVYVDEINNDSEQNISEIRSRRKSTADEDIQENCEAKPEEDVSEREEVAQKNEELQYQGDSKQLDPKTNNELHLNKAENTKKDHEELPKVDKMKEYVTHNSHSHRDDADVEKDNIHSLENSQSQKEDDSEQKGLEETENCLKMTKSNETDSKLTTEDTGDNSENLKKEDGSNNNYCTKNVKHETSEDTEESDVEIFTKEQPPADDVSNNKNLSQNENLAEKEQNNTIESYLQEDKQAPSEDSSVEVSTDEKNEEIEQKFSTNGNRRESADTNTTSTIDQNVEAYCETNQSSDSKENIESTVDDNAKNKPIEELPYKDSQKQLDSKKNDEVQLDETKDAEKCIEEVKKTEQSINSCESPEQNSTVENDIQNVPQTNKIETAPEQENSGDFLPQMKVKEVEKMTENENTCAKPVTDDAERELSENCDHSKNESQSVCPKSENPNNTNGTENVRQEISENAEEQDEDKKFESTDDKAVEDNNSSEHEPVDNDPEKESNENISELKNEPKQLDPEKDNEFKSNSSEKPEKCNEGFREVKNCDTNNSNLDKKDPIHNDPQSDNVQTASKQKNLVYSSSPNKGNGADSVQNDFEEEGKSSKMTGNDTMCPKLESDDPETKSEHCDNSKIENVDICFELEDPKNKHTKSEEETENKEKPSEECVGSDISTEDNRLQNNSNLPDESVDFTKQNISPSENVSENLQITKGENRNGASGSTEGPSAENSDNNLPDGGSNIQQDKTDPNQICSQGDYDTTSKDENLNNSPSENKNELDQNGSEQAKSPSKMAEEEVKTVDRDNENTEKPNIEGCETNTTGGDDDALKDTLNSSQEHVTMENVPNNEKMPDNILSETDKNKITQNCSKKDNVEIKSNEDLPSKDENFDSNENIELNKNENAGNQNEEPCENNETENSDTTQKSDSDKEESADSNNENPPTSENISETYSKRTNEDNKYNDDRDAGNVSLEQENKSDKIMKEHEGKRSPTQQDKAIIAKQKEEKQEVDKEKEEKKERKDNHSNHEPELPLEPNDNKIQSEGKQQFEILSVHEQFQDMDLKKLDNSVQTIDVIRKFAENFEEKVTNFNEEKFSLEYFVLDDKLMSLIEKLDKIKCSKDTKAIKKKVEAIEYINNLHSILDRNAV